jgi:hypothetical protein
VVRNWKRRGLRKHEDIVLGGEVNGLSDRHGGDRLPAVDLPRRLLKTVRRRRNELHRSDRHALPRNVYLSVISATWVFRDSVNIFGILLFGLLLSRLAVRRGSLGRFRAHVLCVLQVASLAMRVSVRPTTAASSVRNAGK